MATSGLRREPCRGGSSLVKGQRRCSGQEGGTDAGGSREERGERVGVAEGRPGGRRYGDGPTGAVSPRPYEGCGISLRGCMQPGRVRPHPSSATARELREASARGRWPAGAGAHLGCGVQAASAACWCVGVGHERGGECQGTPRFLSGAAVSFLR